MQSKTRNSQLIPLAIPNLSGNEAEYLAQCVSTNFVSTVGPFVTAFEDLVAELEGFPNCVATNTGTSALHVALKSLGVQEGDLVVMPSYTFIATANAVRMSGAEPWLFDIDPESWGLDPKLLVAELYRKTESRDGSLWHKELGRRVAAVVAVCAVGQPPQLKEITEAASAIGIPLLIDAAGAAGATYADQSLGCVVDNAVLSFNGNKTFTAGGGGAFLTQNDAAANFARHLSTTARIGEDYSHDMEGFNYRLTNIQAAVGCAQLEQADNFLVRKRAIDAEYRAAWEGTVLESFPRTDWADSACWMTGAVLPKNFPLTAGGMAKELSTRGVQARGFWKPMHLQKPYATCPRTNTMVTDALWTRVLILPSSTSLARREQMQVITAVLELLNSW